MSKHLDSTMTAHIRLSFYLIDQWVTFISIPRGEFTNYTTRPLKWLRYVGSTIYGREGILKGGPDDSEIEDYTTEDVNILLS
ncbi:1530_t:CDS:1, partial [Acaulospora colombiana]